MILRLILLVIIGLNPSKHKCLVNLNLNPFDSLRLHLRPPKLLFFKSDGGLFICNPITIRNSDLESSEGFGGRRSTLNCESFCFSKATEGFLFLIVSIILGVEGLAPPLKL